MTFAPVLPVGGYAGWTFLKRTMATQTATFNAQPALKRDEAYFRSKIAGIDTAAQLVADPRLLRVALGAFGLEADMPNKAFIRKVLEDGTLKPDALANKLADKRYQKLAVAFGFGDLSVPRNKISDFPDKMLAAYKERQFAVAVGQQDGNMRLALNLGDELSDLARSGMSEQAKWFSVIGSTPLRSVFEKAFGLPASFGALDVDKQVEILKTRARSVFGDETVGQFINAEKQEKLIRQFLVRADIEASTTGFSSAQTAIVLLQNVSFGRNR